MRDNCTHGRRSIRLKNYDYSKNGLYFVTICTQNRERIFGEIIDGNMKLNDIGEMVIFFYLDLQNRYWNIKCREYVIMPNHIHFIIEIVNEIMDGESYIMQLKEELQNATNNGKPRFQIRIHFTGDASNYNNAQDGWKYDQNNINLSIEYIP